MFISFAEEGRFEHYMFSSGCVIFPFRKSRQPLRISVTLFIQKATSLLPHIRGLMCGRREIRTLHVQYPFRILFFASLEKVSLNSFESPPKALPELSLFSQNIFTYVHYFAEEGRFELPIRFPRCQFSKLVPSANSAILPYLNRLYKLAFFWFFR